MKRHFALFFFSLSHFARGGFGRRADSPEGSSLSALVARGHFAQGSFFPSMVLVSAPFHFSPGTISPFHFSADAMSPVTSSTFCPCSNSGIVTSRANSAQARNFIFYHFLAPNAKARRQRQSTGRVRKNFTFEHLVASEALNSTRHAFFFGAKNSTAQITTSRHLYILLSGVVAHTAFTHVVWEAPLSESTPEWSLG